MIENRDCKPYEIKENSRVKKVHKKRIYSINGNAAVLAITIIILFIINVLATRCITDTNSLVPEGLKGSGNEYSVKNSDIGKYLGTKREGILKILTQNTMLIPFSFVAPAYAQRTFCLIELILEKYDIVGLQEVFAGSSQNQIISTWHNEIYNEMNSGMPGNWQYDYFNNWYSSLQGSEKKMWQPLNSAIDVEKLAEKDSCWGVRVINSKPNHKDARLVCSPYYVMGPDGRGLPVQQDGGLVILSRYPIIACSAFSFKISSGTDNLANKGAVYARIQIGPSAEDYIHVFNTHLQSHDYAETRQEHIRELLNFMVMIVEPEGINCHPIIIMGDFNVAADVCENWMEISGIISSPDEYKQEDNPDLITIPSLEYKEFNNEIKNFEETDPEGKLYLEDVWLNLNPDDPGFTWIGRDWTTGGENPYGNPGNQIAIETGRPQRIDYIFYFDGSGDINIDPKSINLLPEEPKILYYYDREPYQYLIFSNNDCVKISENSDCSFKSYTVSDHLGLEADFDFKIDR